MIKKRLLTWTWWVWWWCVLGHHYGMAVAQDGLVMGEDAAKRVALYEAIDSVIELSSGATSASRVPVCVQSLKDLMVRAGIPTDAGVLRGENYTDAQLLRLGLLAAIARISPWDQNPQSGKFYIAEHSGVLVEAFHPSASESDIMLCVVCTLLAVIVMFHVTNAQMQYVQSSEPTQPTGLSTASGTMMSSSSKGH